MSFLHALRDAELLAFVQSVLLCWASCQISFYAASIAFSATANATPALPDLLHTLFADFCLHDGTGGPCNTSPLLSFFAAAGPDKVPTN